MCGPVGRRLLEAIGLSYRSECNLPRLMVLVSLTCYSSSWGSALEGKHAHASPKVGMTLHSIVARCPFKQLHVLSCGCFQAYMCNSETTRWNTVGKNSAAVVLHQRFSYHTSCSSLVVFFFYFIDASTPTHNWCFFFLYSKDPHCEDSWIHSIHREAANLTCLGRQLILWPHDVTEAKV